MAPKVGPDKRCTPSAAPFAEAAAGAKAASQVCSDATSKRKQLEAAETLQTLWDLQAKDIHGKLGVPPVNLAIRLIYVF